MQRSGGRILRELRKSRNETIENIATDAGITYKTLQGIETGSTKSPSPDTLRRIIDALHMVMPIPLIEHQSVFTAFGYQKPYPLPSQMEIENAIREWKKSYRDVPYPAYLVDCAQRLLDWNQYAPRLLGLKNDDVRAQQFSGVTIYDIIFALSDMFVSIDNRNEYLADLIKTTKAQDTVFQHEEWYKNFLHDVLNKYPELAELWESITIDETIQFHMGNTKPIKLRILGAEVLTFRLTAINYVLDSRFWVVHWTPLDDVTILQCLMWAKEAKLNTG